MTDANCTLGEPRISFERAVAVAEPFKADLIVLSAVAQEGSGRP